MTKSILFRYKNYKESGVEWLKEIPEHWQVKRIKEVSEINKKSLSENTPNDYEFEYIDIGSVTYGSKNILKEKMVYGSSPSRAKRIVKKGDTIISTVRTYLKAISSIQENADNLIVSTGFAVITPLKQIDSKYCSYLVSSEFMINKICAYSSGVSYPATTSTFIGDLLFLVPPKNEQISIAKYLDEKTSLIDKKIELLTQKAKRYKELKQSLINETVTCGLDKAVKLKESGVDWIGKIPVHWELGRIADAFTERSKKVNDSDYPPLSVTKDGIVPQLENAAKTDHNDNRRLVKIGDFVINSRSDRRGSSGVSEIEGSVSVISIILEPEKKFYGKFIHHLFRSYRFIEEFYRVGRGIVNDLWTTKYSVMRTIEFASPSYDEQKEIAEYLDKKTSQIDKIASTIELKIDKFKELRKTLINDVVTGKIKVHKED